MILMIFQFKKPVMNRNKMYWFFDPNMLGVSVKEKKINHGIFVKV